jgi:lysophospholipase L1-like esterase
MPGGRRPRVGVGGGAGQLSRRHARPGIPARALAWVSAAAAVAAGVLIGVWSAPPAGATVAPPYLLALGGSASVGVQPTAAHPRGQPTSSGYADDLIPLERPHWPGLTVVHLGCPGATTVTMLDGGGHCPYADGTQLSTAEAFLRAHPSTALVTVDLGFNDLLACMRHEVVDAACVDGALATVHDQLGQILSALRSAAAPGTTIVGVGHYDPYLGDFVRGPAGQAFAAASLGVMERLDDTLRAVYRAAGVPMADVAADFAMRDHQAVTRPGLGTVPTDVAETCALTWMCDPPPLGHNPHPDDAGYRTIAAAIAEAVSALSDGAAAGS